MSAFFDLRERLTSWFFRRDRDIVLQSGRKVAVSSANIEISNGNLTITTGNITITGTVDGIDISVHAADSDAHHAESHTLASHSGTLSHDSDLTDVSENDHHNRSHALDSGSDHTGTLPWSDLSKSGSDLADLATRNHDDLNSVGVNDHHNESHTIASHSDTSGTGAELNTLTDGSDASSLHDHDGRYYQESEFSTSPGAAAAPLRTDSGGKITLYEVWATTTLRTGGGVTLGSVSVSATSGTLYLEEQGSSPSTPTSGFTVLYAGSNGRLYYRVDGGTIYGPL